MSSSSELELWSVMFKNSPEYGLGGDNVKKFFYICPRCGRRWTRLWPRSVMKCDFCGESWNTVGKKTTSSRFSFSATLLWLVGIALVAFVVVKHDLIKDKAMSYLSEAKVASESVQAKPVVPELRSLTREQKLELASQDWEKRQQQEEDAVEENSDDVATADNTVPQDEKGNAETL